MYHFSKKIKCADCSGNYRAITERGKKKYFCSTYHNYKTCLRWKVDEEMLLDLLRRHYDIGLIKSGQVQGDSSRKPVEWQHVSLETLIDRVEEISASPKQQTIHIRYTDGTSTLIEPKHYAYWTDQL